MNALRNIFAILLASIFLVGCQKEEQSTVLSTVEYLTGFDTSYLSLNNRKWKQLPVPGSFPKFDSTQKKSSYITLRAKIPDSLIANSSSNHILALKTGRGGDAAEIFINKEPLCTLGSLMPFISGADQEKTITIAPWLLKPQEPNYIYFVHHIHNNTTFHGIRTPSCIGKSEIVFRENYKEMIIAFFLLGSFITMAIFFLALGILRISDIYNLYFGLLTLAFSIFLTANTAIKKVLYFEHPLIEFHVDLASGICITACGILFIVRLLTPRLSMLMKIIVSSLFTLAITSLFSHGSELHIFRTIWYVFLAATTPLLIVFAIYYARKGMYEAQIILVGICFFGISGIHDALAFAGLVPFVFTLPYAFIILLTASTLLLIQKFVLVSKKLEHLTASLEETIANRTSDLEATLREKDNLVNIVAHDLKNPISSIVGISDLLFYEKEIAASAESRNLVTLIRKACEQAQSIITNVLSSAKDSKAQKKEAFETVVLNDIIISECAIFQSKLKKKKQTLILPEPLPSVTVTLHISSLIRILHNLLSNAIKFTPNNGTIRITITNNEKMGILTIADSGIGIPQASIDTIFEKFTKAGRSGTQNEESTGLGLYIVKDLVEFLGGTITVKSIEGRGTTMIVGFPRT